MAQLVIVNQMSTPNHASILDPPLAQIRFLTTINRRSYQAQPAWISNNHPAYNVDQKLLQLGT